MNDHVSLEKLHDYVHDFVDAAQRGEIRMHTTTCENCREEVRRLTSEREAIAVAMEDAPVPTDTDVEELKRRLSGGRRSASPTWAPLAVAAAVMVGLLGFMFSGSREPARIPGQQVKPAARESRVKRFTQIVTDESKRHQDLAVLALSSCGSSGWEALKRIVAAHPKLASLLAAPLPPNDAALVAKVEKIKLDSDFQDTQLIEVLGYYRDFTGLNFLLDQNLPSVSITFKTTDLPMKEALDQLCEQVGGEWYATNGTFVLRKRVGMVEPARGAVRSVVQPAQLQAAKAAVAKLSDDQVTVRDAAANELRKLGFAAEETLWELLEAPDAEVRSRGENLLRELYTPTPPRRPEDHPSRALITRVDVVVDLDFDKSPLRKVMEYFHEIAELNYVLVDGADEPITLKVRNLAISKALEYILQATKCTGWFDGDVLYVVNASRLATSEPTPWVRADRCEAIEAALGELASGKNVSFAAFEVDGVHALRAAGLGRRADELEAELSTRFWFTDRDFFPKEAAHLVKKLEKPIDLDAAKLGSLKDALDLISGTCGVKCTWKNSGKVQPIKPADFQLKKAKASDALAALARKFGCGIRVEGDSIVFE